MIMMAQVDKMNELADARNKPTVMNIFQDMFLPVFGPVEVHIKFYECLYQSISIGPI